MRPVNNDDIKTCLSIAKGLCQKSVKRKRYLCVQQTYLAKHDFDLLTGNKNPEMEVYNHCHWVRSTYKVQPGEVMFVVETSIKTMIDVKNYSNVMLEESDGAIIAKLKHQLRYQCNEYLKGSEIDEAVNEFLQVQASKIASKWQQ